MTPNYVTITITKFHTILMECRTKSHRQKVTGQKVTV
jgi:hypothetical protein